MSNSIITLRPGETALFGYGSLISIASLERTLGRSYDGPYIPCVLQGWRRSWDVSMPNQNTFYAETPRGRMWPEQIIYLNIREAEGDQVNGMLFVVGRDELESFDRREWVYERRDVTPELRGAQLDGGRAYAYVALQEHKVGEVDSTQQAAIRKTYLDILEAGFRDLGDDFRLKFLASSDPVPKHLVIEDKRHT
jgi:cation transport regulator ChaC